MSPRSRCRTPGSRVAARDWAVCDRIVATGVLDRVRADARGRVDEAKRALEGAALDQQRRELLTMVAEGVFDRYS